ncbi:peptidoglycan-binding domain-containing protein [Actinomadura sp. HBU206391]|uniref:peptidoglycan-binding protein n=1 Tax=Actinomadura sp. HBU206391 TaxID=2731692 RepID=UPI00164FD96D|nr:peptidoglycan-binding domain-containing protein [Actinomadura sp. HBU206391]MBC6458624.1 peptidoglycan-binding protein [Actinomadura sp. HBU206391]
MRRMRAAAATGIALAGIAGAAGWAVTSGRAADSGQRPVTGVTTSTAAVVRTDVAQRRQVNGTLGHAGTYDVIATGQGTLTRLPSVGQVVKRGEAAYEVDGSPVVLLYGRRPAWRAFSSGMTDGTDVRQLETNLKALGYGAAMTVDRHFSTATYWAIRAWQKDARLTVTGTVPLGQIVFTPAAVRISTHDLKIGTRVQPGTRVERGTSAERAVTAQLSPAEIPRVRVGDPVVVTLPEGGTVRGKITVVGAVAVPTSGGGDDSGNGPDGGGSGGENESIAPITIKVTGKIRGFLDQAEVQVAITEEAHEDVLAVPMTALRALPGGKYKVIVVDGTATRHVPVETGLFDETAGLVEVEGPGLSEGQKVEVPRDGS